MILTEKPRGILSHFHDMDQYTTFHIYENARTYWCLCILHKLFRPLARHLERHDLEIIDTIGSTDSLWLICEPYPHASQRCRRIKLFAVS